LQSALKLDTVSHKLKKIKAIVENPEAFVQKVEVKVETNKPVVQEKPVVVAKDPSTEPDDDGDGLMDFF